MLTNKIFNASALISLLQNVLRLGSAKQLSLVGSSADCSQQVC